MRAVVASASPAPTPSRVRHLVRHFLATPSRGHGHDHVEDDAAEVRVTFVLKDKTERVIVGLEGQNLLRLAQQHAHVGGGGGDAGGGRLQPDVVSK